ncbi:MAG: phage antirepressor KilAC domain-containing protein [[Clostridium] leptum]
MNKVTIFKYEENKLVRTMDISGEPWFVLKDVCDVLGLSTPARVAERLDSDEVSQAHLIDSMGRSQEMTIISESGLYNVILRSDKPEAKPFRKWVTAVVLPSIRKNGGYIAGQEELSPQELMAKALLVAQKTLTDRDARIKELTAQNQIMQPKAEYFDELVARNLLTNFRETAKELGIKEKDFVGWLLEHKYIYRDQKNKLMPYAAKNNGLFEVKERTGRHNDWAGTQTLITPKGRETFRLLCKEPA